MRYRYANLPDKVHNISKLLLRLHLDTLASNYGPEPHEAFKRKLSDGMVWRYSFPNQPIHHQVCRLT